ncbi:MAG TPA: NAD-dependent epimerase/dehydratase family protein [Pyrinomonadaceae bacterium]|nr:NAD-dependent epimerase/dehydratase family protein [Pyrinomonadaceae bacterium]
MSNIVDPYRGCSVLITGGLGFIGSNLAHCLAAMDDVEVVIIDALIPNQGGNEFNLSGIGDNVKIHRADMGDQYIVNYLVRGIDYIFNLAGQPSHIDSFNHPQRDLDLNCTAQLTLLEACRKFNPHVKIVFTSTRQVYGCPVYLPVDEQHQVAPVDVNGIHKLAAEHYHLLYQRTFGIRSTCLRLTNTYGPRQLLSHNKQGFFGWFLRQALTGGVIELYGKGQQRRDLNYVDDVVEALLLAGASENADGEIFNLGGDEPVSLAEVAGELIALTGHGCMINVPFPPGQQLIDIGNCWLSCLKIETALGWKPRTPLRLGLNRTIEYYQKHLTHYLEANRNLFSRFEMTEVGS